MRVPPLALYTDVLATSGVPVISKRARRIAKDWIPPVALRALTARRQPATRLGLNGLDTRLAEHLDFSSPGYFVELGAHNGLLSSNTYFLEVEFGWRGLLIEPSINNYFECLKNRSGLNSFACVACVPFGFSEVFVRMTYADSMTISSSMELDLPDPGSHVELGVQFMPDARQVVDYGAVAEPLDNVLRRVEAPSRMELLSLDVEGAELSVLNGINHDDFRFEAILAETRTPERISEALAKVGYKYVDRLSHHDYLFRDASLK